MNFFKKKKVKIGLLVLSTFIAVFVIYSNSISNEKKDAGVQETVTVRAERGNLKDAVSASGQIETANYLTVTTSVNGIVNNVYVKEGDMVTKGQAIMYISLNSEGEESLASAWSAYQIAKNALDSAQNTLIAYESALISAEEAFEDEKESNSYRSHSERVDYALAENAAEVAQGTHDNQQNVISQKQTALNKAWLTYQAQSPKIVAPGNGVIANIVVVEGMDITNSLSERTSTTVASIRKEGTPIASLNISEVDINQVQVGQRVEISLNSIDDKTFLGEVVGIDKIGTVSSGVSNYPVIVKFDKDSNLVLPNMGVDAEIIIQEKEDVVYVPSAAVLSVKDNTVVNVQDGDETIPTQVETGISTNEFTEIISGIEEGTTVFINTLTTSGFKDTEGESGSGSSRGILPGMGSSGRR